jgi:hypothetical protein
MVVEIAALGILFALAILFIALPVAIWLIGRVLAMVDGIFQGAVLSAPEESGVMALHEQDQERRERAQARTKHLPFDSLGEKIAYTPVPIVMLVVTAFLARLLWANDTVIRYMGITLNGAPGWVLVAVTSGFYVWLLWAMWIGNWPDDERRKT